MEKSNLQLFSGASNCSEITRAAPCTCIDDVDAAAGLRLQIDCDCLRSRASGPLAVVRRRSYTGRAVLRLDQQSESDLKLGINSLECCITCSLTRSSQS